MTGKLICVEGLGSNPVVFSKAISKISLLRTKYKAHMAKSISLLDAWGFLSLTLVPQKWKPYLKSLQNIGSMVTVVSESHIILYGNVA